VSGDRRKTGVPLVTRAVYIHEIKSAEGSARRRERLENECGGLAPLDQPAARRAPCWTLGLDRSRLLELSPHPGNDSPQAFELVNDRPVTGAELTLLVLGGGA
jgi:hypothetical protein